MTSLLLDTLADRALGEIGTDRGKRTLTTPTDYPLSPDQATNIPEGRSAASGGSGGAGGCGREPGTKSREPSVVSS